MQNHDTLIIILVFGLLLIIGVFAAYYDDLSRVDWTSFFNIKTYPK